MAAVRKAFADAGLEFGKTVSFLDELGKGVDGAMAIGDALGNAAEKMGLLGQDGEKALAIFNDIASAAQQIASGNIFQMIAGGINLLGTIGGALGIGESAEEKERKALERKNIEHLQEIEHDLGNISFDFTGTDISGLQEAFDVVTDPKQFKLEDNTKLGNRVGDVLEGFGLSMLDVKRITEEMGFTFTNTADFYRFFADTILPKAMESLTKFGDSLDQQTLKADIRARLSGEDDKLSGFGQAQAEFQRTLDVFRQFNPKMAAIFGDLGSESWTREALQSLEEQFEAGTLDLGGLTKEQFLDFLEQGADYLDAFNNRLQEATSMADLGARLRGEDIGLEGLDKAQAEFQRMLDVFMQFNPQLAAAFSDLGDQDAVRNALVEMFNQLQEGTLDLGDLTRDQFLEFLNMGADYLDAFNESVQDATKSTINLPAGFKIMDAAFRASAAGGPESVVKPTQMKKIDEIISDDFGLKDMTVEEFAKEMLGRGEPITPDSLAEAMFRMGQVTPVDAEADKLKLMFDELKKSVEQPAPVDDQADKLKLLFDQFKEGIVLDVPTDDQKDNFKRLADEFDKSLTDAIPKIGEATTEGQADMKLLFDQFKRLTAPGVTEDETAVGLQELADELRLLEGRRGDDSDSLKKIADLLQEQMTGWKQVGTMITRTAPPPEGTTGMKRWEGTMPTETKQTIEKVEINIQGTGDPDTVARKVVQAMRTIGMSQTGNSLQGLQLF
jgi:hypothetical protein